MHRVTDYLDVLAQKMPDRVAYSDEKRRITFRQLKTEAYDIAYALIKRHLFKKPIVIYMDKRVECITAMMGIAYSGNFYTPIDTKMPETRVKLITDILSPEIIVTDLQSYDKASAISNGIPIIVYENLIGKLEGNDIQRIEETKRKVIDTDTVYVLFTSGSTGVPKGVIISHKAVMNYTEWVCAQFGIDEDTVLGNEAPLYFDLSIQDIYAPIKTGCETVLIDKSKFAFPAVLMKHLCETKVNTIFWVPSALCAVANLRGLASKYAPDLKKVLFCGEVMPNKQLNMWRRKYPDTMFVNLYGPTEACDACAYYLVDRSFRDDESLPIGFPAENTDIFLLDEKDQLIKGQDITGEICIRGIALSDGYYHNPEKTRESFVQNPLNKAYDEMVYRTGDLAYYNDRHELVFVSRKDYQIKHMGHRIELGEIEAAAVAVDEVAEACCFYHDMKKVIVLFYSGEISEANVKTQLGNRLPHYMIPNEYIHLKVLPHNMNGKVDREDLKKRSI